MDAGEGLKRIAVVIRWLGLTVGLVILVWGLWLARGHDNAAAVVAFSVGGFALFAGGGWLVAWIVEGFAGSRNSAS